MHNIINFLDPKNVLGLRDWVALCGLLFTIFSFFTAQYLTARSQRLTRQLAVRPYFLVTRAKNKIKLSTEDEGIGAGMMIVTKDYRELSSAHKQNKQINGIDIDKIYYLQVRNLGPSYALDCKFQVKCKEKDNGETWDIEGYMPIFNKDEYIYIPLENVQYYNRNQSIKEIKISFKTQSKESLVLRQFSDESSNMKVVISKEVFWGLFNKKIVEFPNVNGVFKSVD
ncbi:hypothetical protein [Priestia aryabhattai]|uniref:hypothetical protein n=1 Tax=Priestia aryabhattai TaxID=412384 RepID=UPI002658A88A|nr:hypothetical protein [Priestia aryabhattai]WKG30192.1 hypothetical protein QYS54_23980 [Priestia aryabhattai]